MKASFSSLFIAVTLLWLSNGALWAAALLAAAILWIVVASYRRKQRAWKTLEAYFGADIADCPYRSWAWLEMLDEGFERMLRNGDDWRERARRDPRLARLGSFPFGTDARQMRSRLETIWERELRDGNNLQVHDGDRTIRLGELVALMQAWLVFHGENAKLNCFVECRPVR